MKDTFWKRKNQHGLMKMIVISGTEMITKIRIQPRFNLVLQFLLGYMPYKTVSVEIPSTVVAFPGCILCSLQYQLTKCSSNSCWFGESAHQCN